MDENSYEYECMRAELLGIEKPSMDEYMSRQKTLEKEKVEQEEVDVENIKEIEKESEEDFRNVSGGLHELSSILAATQKKLNRFKVSCGSLTNLLKIKIGNVSGSSESIVLSSGPKHSQEVVDGLDNTSMTRSPKKEGEDAQDVNYKKSDLAKALDNHVDKLDLLIDKAENCQYSMSEQNKQMKKFLH